MIILTFKMFLDLNLLYVLKFRPLRLRNTEISHSVILRQAFVTYRGPSLQETTWRQVVVAEEYSEFYKS